VRQTAKRANLRGLVDDDTPAAVGVCQRNPEGAIISNRQVCNHWASDPNAGRPRRVPLLGAEARE
jgi:hypothetical protein